MALCILVLISVKTTWFTTQWVIGPLYYKKEPRVHPFQAIMMLYSPRQTRKSTNQEMQLNQRCLHKQLIWVPCSSVVKRTENTCVLSKPETKDPSAPATIAWLTLSSYTLQASLEVWWPMVCLVLHHLKAAIPSSNRSKHMGSSQVTKLSLGSTMRIHLIPISWVKYLLEKSTTTKWKEVNLDLTTTLILQLASGGCSWMTSSTTASKWAKTTKLWLHLSTLATLPFKCQKACIFRSCKRCVRRRLASSHSLLKESRSWWPESHAISCGIL